MNITIPDDICNSLGLDETEMLEFVAVSLYKKMKIHGARAGRILGISEFEFHALLEKYGEYVNYDVDDLIADIKNLENL